MTLAQQCADAFRAQVVTTSVNALALPLGGTRIKRGTALHWEFPDGSTLISSGRGWAHKLEVRSRTDKPGPLVQGYLK